MKIERRFVTACFIPYLYNKARNNKDVCVFEMGKGFFKEDGIYKEELKLAALMTGKYYLDINDSNVDFYVVKGVVEELLDSLGYNGRYSIINGNVPKELHPGMSGVINLQGKDIGFIGRIHPTVCKDEVYVFEINLDELLKNRTSNIKFKEIPKFLSMQKDVAFIVNKKVTNKEITDIIKKTGGRLLSDIKLFDIYTGEKVKEDEKSLAYSLTFSDETKTLTEEEVMQNFNNIIKKVTETIPATLRDN